jgi:hypothetical protein
MPARKPLIVATALLAAAPVVAPHALAARHADGCARGGSPTAVSWARHRHMLAIVDSVLLGGAPALKSAMPCWHITIRGRPALMIRIADRELRAQHPRVPRLVVVALGYNSLWERGRKRYAFWSRRFDHEALALLATLRRLGARQFVWVTLRQPNASIVPPGSLGELYQYAWYFPYVNERLRRLARRRDDLVLADWETVSHRRGVTYDTIHLNSAGAALMARTIKHAITHEAARQTASPARS